MAIFLNSNFVQISCSLQLCLWIILPLVLKLTNIWKISLLTWTMVQGFFQARVSVPSTLELLIATYQVSGISSENWACVSWLMKYWNIFSCRIVLLYWNNFYCVNQTDSHTATKCCQWIVRLKCSKWTHAQFLAIFSWNLELWKVCRGFISHWVYVILYSFVANYRWNFFLYTMCILVPMQCTIVI